MTVVALDFETANERRDSACAIGLAWIEGGRVVRRASRLIRPPELRFAPGENAAAEAGVVAALGGVAQRVEALPDRLLLYVDDGEAAVQRVRDRGMTPVSTLVRRSTLEDVFLRLTGRSLVD